MDEQTPLPNIPQQPTATQDPPLTQSSNKLLLIIAAIALLGFGLLGGYILRGNTYQSPIGDSAVVAMSPAPQLPTEIPSPTKNLIPADWTVKTSMKCNVGVPIPPKKEPYLISDDPKTPPSVNDEGRFWQYQESTNSEAKQFKNVAYATFITGNELGSDYAPGVVSVECDQNTKNFSTDTLVEDYETQFKDGTFSGIAIAKKTPQTMWGKEVIALIIQGGMFDDNEPQYLFATDKHIYRVHKTAMSSNIFVKETTNTILQNLQFKD